MRKKIIPLYKERAFGEKVSATFDFLTGHIKLWLKCCLYLFLPLSLVQAIALNGMFGGMTDLSAMEEVEAVGGDYSGVISFALSYLGYIFFMAVGGLLMSAFIYAMIRYYRDNDNSLEGVTLRDMAPQIKANFWSGLRVGLLLVGLLIVWGVLVAVTAITVVLPILLVVALIVACVPVSLAMPVRMFEDDNTAWETVKRAFRLGWNTWGGTFLLMFVVGLIANILQGICSAPWYIVWIVKTIFEVDGSHTEITDAGWFGFLYYIFAVLQTFGTYLAMSLSVTALAYQYGSAAEKMDSVSVDEDIDNFENI